QRGFHEKLGSQCGYCTPGFIMASAGLLRRNPRPTEDDIRAALGSNICRCTGYVKIIEAVQYAADLHAGGAPPWSRCGAHMLLRAPFTLPWRGRVASEASGVG